MRNSFWGLGVFTGDDGRDTIINTPKTIELILEFIYGDVLLLLVGTASQKSHQPLIAKILHHALPPSLNFLDIASLLLPIPF